VFRRVPDRHKADPNLQPAERLLDRYLPNRRGAQKDVVGAVPDRSALDLSEPAVVCGLSEVDGGVDE
jgi:hypothetical protein